MDCSLRVSGSASGHVLMDRSSSLGQQEEQKKAKQATDEGWAETPMWTSWFLLLHLEGLCGRDEGRQDKGHWMMKDLGPHRKDLKLFLEAKGASSKQDDELRMTC